MLLLGSVQAKSYDVVLLYLVDSSHGLPTLQPFPSASNHLIIQMSKPIGISMLGCGTVGLPLFRMLSGAGDTCCFRTIVVGNPDQPKYDELRLVEGLNLISSAEYDESGGAEILQDGETDIVVEVIGGSAYDDSVDPYEKTRDRLLNAIQAGKHIVTANKTVIAFWGPECFEAADKAGVNIAFEAAVAGSIPIIRLLRTHWKGQGIRKIAGILNGTCNYILTRMPEFRDAHAPMPDSEKLGREVRRAHYDSYQNGGMQWALDHAQVEGLAEAEPSFDVDGHDAAQKLAILASLAFDTFIEPSEKNIPRSSILPLTLDDMKLTEGLGFVIKPLAVAQKEEDSIELRVHPCLIPARHPLASVSGAFNGVYLESVQTEGQPEGFGEQLYYGKGAGGDATATALFSDVLEVARRIQDGMVDNPTYYRSDKNLEIISGEDQEAPGYIKSTSRDVPGVFMNKTRILYGEEESERINIHQIYNLHEYRSQGLVPDVITIWPTPYRNVQRALKRFVKEGVAEEEPLFLRIEE